MQRRTCVVPCTGKRLEENIFWGEGKKSLRGRIFLSMVFLFLFYNFYNFFVLHLSMLLSIPPF